jgi:hypothetical protein
MNRMNKARVHSRDTRVRWERTCVVLINRAEPRYFNAVNTKETSNMPHHFVIIEVSLTSHVTCSSGELVSQLANCINQVGGGGRLVIKGGWGGDVYHSSVIFGSG